MLTFKDIVKIHKISKSKESENIQDESYSIASKTKLIKQEISQSGFSRDNFHELRKKFYVQYKNTKSIKYLEILKVVSYIFGLIENDNELKGYKEDNEKLISCYVITLGIMKDPSYASYIPDDEDLDRKLSAVKYFRQKNYKISIHEGEINFGEISKICLLIDQRIKTLGSDAIFLTLDYLKKCKRKGFYAFYDASAETLIPIGFIFNKSLKFLTNTSKIESESKSKFIDVVELSKNYIALYGIQKGGIASQFEYIYSSPKSFINLLTRQVISDQVFKINQYEPKSIYDFIYFVKSQYNYTELDALEDIAHQILEKPMDISTRVNDIFHNLSKKYDKCVINYLSKILINKNINEYFFKYNDYDNVNYNKKPFVLINKTDIMFLNHSFFYIGFYKSLFQILFDKGHKNEQGILVEKFAEHQLSGISDNFIQGDKEYKVSKDMRQKLGIKSETLESDMIVYNNKSIAFFEIKLRELVDGAKNGNQYLIMDDLVNSLVRSQTQLNKYKRYLCENGKIEFKSDENLIYDNRDILKISISSLEYSGLSSRLIFEQFLKHIYSIRLTQRSDNNYGNTIKTINKYITEYQEEFKMNKDLDDMNSYGAFRNTFYLNLFQLIFLIRQSKINNKSLIDEITTNKILISDQSDFYMHYNQFKK